VPEHVDRLRREQFAGRPGGRRVELEREDRQ
jgi:hypothetical protein